MTCYNNCAHWRVCENISDPCMEDIISGKEVEKHCSAFLEIKQGVWKYYSSTMMECSVCQRHTARHRYEFCPHCGAKMDKEETKND